MAHKRAEFCLDCEPGGPYPAPACRRCGSIIDYFSAGLCGRCHQYAPQPPGSCRDCHAWGVHRIRDWLCHACIGWRQEYPTVAACRSCAQHRHVGRGAVCRLCWRQASDAREATKRQRPYRPIDVLAANCNGQQLFFADIGRRRHPRRVRVYPTPGPRRLPCKQLGLFDPRPDTWASRRGLPEPPKTARTNALEALVRDYGARHGWSANTIKRTRQAMRVLAAHTKQGKQFKASDLARLIDLELPVKDALAVLGEADLIDDDRIPAVVNWFERQIGDLPAAMADELRIWFDIQHRGSSTPPRTRPRAPVTIRLRLRYALPALRSWAAVGHQSLREISRGDVIEVLPPSGNERALTGVALRSIFRTLKAHKVVFTNPTARLPTGTAERRRPLPVDIEVLRAAIHSTDPARAALASLLAFHGLRPGQLRTLKLTEVRDGRAVLDHRTVPLAEPVRQRIGAWLDYRNGRWPNTANPYLFVHHRTATGTGPIGHTWVGRTLGIAPRAIRIDRILDEVRATGGDIRRLCDLFGLSVTAAVHYIEPTDPGTFDDAQGRPTENARRDRGPRDQA